MVLRGDKAVREYWDAVSASVEWHPEDERLQRGALIFMVVHQRVRDANASAVGGRRVAHVLAFRGGRLARLQAFDSMDEGLAALFGAANESPGSLEQEP